MRQGAVQVAEGLEAHADELMKEAHRVVKHGWRPAFFMIDKYRPSKLAIQRGRVHTFLNVAV